MRCLYKSNTIMNIKLLYIDSVKSYERKLTHGLRVLRPREGGKTTMSHGYLYLLFSKRFVSLVKFSTFSHLPWIYMHCNVSHWFIIGWSQNKLNLRSLMYKSSKIADLQVFMTIKSCEFPNDRLHNLTAARPYIFGGTITRLDLVTWPEETRSQT